MASFHTVLLKHEIPLCFANMLMSQDIHTTAGMIPQVGQASHDLPIFDTSDGPAKPSEAAQRNSVLPHERDDNSEHLPGYYSREDERDDSYAWPAWKKAAVVVALSAVTFTTAVTPRTIDESLATTQKASDASFGLRDLTKLSLSLYFIALALGQMILAPLSEVIGRSIVLLLSSMLHLALSVGLLYVHDSVAITVLRALQGLCASGCLAIALGTLVDIFKPARRQAAFHTQIFLIFFAQAATPVYSSWISDVAQPHFVMTTHVFLSAISTLLLSALIFETRRNVSDGIGAQIGKAIMECALLLFSDPAVLCVAAWLALTQIAISLSVSTLPFFVGTSIADPTERTLARKGVLAACHAAMLAAACLAIIISSIVSTLLSCWRQDPHAEAVNDTRNARRCGLPRRKKIRGDQDALFSTPENRLPNAAIGALALLVGAVVAFIGTRSPNTLILAPVAAGSLALGSYLCQLGCLLYLADVYESKTSSAVAAALVFAYIFEAVTPSTGVYLCGRFGTFGVSLAAICTSVAAAVLPSLLVMKGTAIRSKSRVARGMEKRRQTQELARCLRADASFADAIIVPELVEIIHLPKYSESCQANAKRNR